MQIISFYGLPNGKLEPASERDATIRVQAVARGGCYFPRSETACMCFVPEEFIAYDLRDDAAPVKFPTFAELRSYFENMSVN